MIQFLKRLFGIKSKVQSGGSSFTGAFVPPTPSKDVQLSAQKKSVDQTATLPLWFVSNCNFDEISFLNHSGNLLPPKITKEVREALKSYVGDVCPEPSTALTIYQKLNNRDIAVREVAKLVSSDPLLAAQVLRVVNSSAYYTTTEVTSMGRAVTLLGLQTIRSIVLSHSINRSMSSLSDKDMNKQIVQDHCAMVSSIAMVMSENIAGVDQYEASTIGLMHDIGKILYPLVIEKGKKIVTNMDIPTEVLESLLASTFAEIWGLPTSLVYAIQYTSYPYFYKVETVPEEYRKLVALIASSNLLAKALGFADGEMHYSVEESFTSLIGLQGAPEFWLTPDIVMLIEQSRQTLES